MLQTLLYQVKEVRVSLHPVFLEVWDASSQLWKVQVLDLFGLVANCHLIEDNAKCPHVNGSRNPSFICHLRGLVISRSYHDLHVGLLAVRVDYMAQTEVTDLCHWDFLVVGLLTVVLMLDQDIVDFDVCVNDPTLMQILKTR